MSMMERCGMRQQDWMVFSKAARMFKKWILVRWTNEESLKYIGRKSIRFSYAPKPIDCKPKTAHVSTGGKEQAGLVVALSLAPDAFRDEKPKKVEGARNAWKEFAASKGGFVNAEEFNQKQIMKAGIVLQRTADMGQILHVEATRGVPRDVINQLNIKFGFSYQVGARLFLVDRDEQSPHYGCLTLNGSYLFGDYDLKDVIDAQHPGRVMALSGELYGQPHMTNMPAGEVAVVQNYVNSEIGVNMVQHHPEVFYADHHEDEDDRIEVFNPTGYGGTLQGEAEVRQWYDVLWNRGTIDLKQQTMSKTILPPSQLYFAKSKGGIIVST